MNRCEVRNNKASAIKASSGVEINIADSYFKQNFAGKGAALNLVDANLTVKSSSFENNVARGIFCNNTDSLGGVASLTGTSAVFENSTFVKNEAYKGAVFHVDGSQLSLKNITASGNSRYDSNYENASVIYANGSTSTVALKACMIVGNGDYPFLSELSSLNVTSSDYNIYSTPVSWTKGSNDMQMSTDEIITILDGSSVNSSYFSPTLRLNDGYTPTVAVVASLFSGGEVLTIPSLDRYVDCDQRGFLRKDTSCVGAYEFPTLYGYYVKTRSHGDGTGRNWANAMSDTTFAKYFPIVPSGATFHISEGTYRPMFNTQGKLQFSKSNSFKSARIVNLIGGYPANAVYGDKPSPSENHKIGRASCRERVWQSE